jgi:hypothetical protein
VEFVDRLAQVVCVDDAAAPLTEGFLKCAQLLSKLSFISELDEASQVLTLSGREFRHGLAGTRFARSDPGHTRCGVTPQPVEMNVDAQ